jgi:NTP pyrophosphatase (non-canonical NTP hydrolase)
LPKTLPQWEAGNPNYSMDDKTKEILLITQEECAEVTQAISKIFRFGMDAKHPATQKTNKERLEEEVGDLLSMIDIMVKNCIVSDEKINEARKSKVEKLKIWSTIQGL